MMNAYDRDYLYHAQKNFAHMVDFAVNTCDLDIDEFFNMFLASEVCKQFENGNPAYIAGKTGCELVRMIVDEIKEEEILEEDRMFLDRSPEYWLGWVLSFYTWKKNYKFGYVLAAVPAGDMIGMYDTMHEADITKFVAAMDERMSDHYTNTELARIRSRLGISQAELAKRSGVNVRIIQSYEQRLRDINKAQSEVILKLSHVLECSIEDLLEKK